MLTCDTCHEKYEDSKVCMNELGEFRCVYCLGLEGPHPVLMASNRKLDISELEVIKPGAATKREGS